LSPLIGAMFGGILCGPNGLDIVPWWCDPHKSEWCEGVTPFVMLGQIGVTFMIAESGTHFNYKKVKKVIGKAFGVAVLGTFVPLISGMLLFWSLGFELFPDSFAAGAALAPTSVGIAIKLLTEHKQLSSDAGQTIVTAAFIDDVFSLVILVVLLNLAEGSLGAWTLIEPLLYSFLYLSIGAVLSVVVWPIVIHDCILDSMSERSHLSHQPRDMVHLGLMLGFLVFMSWVGDLIGSHLLGAFLAGMSFSEVPRSHYVWKRQMKRVNAWCVRMFFAATVGFVIPVKEMFTVGSFWRGCAVAISAAIVGKIIAGLHTGEYRWVIGFAMVGRGEFAYLIAETAKSTCYSGSYSEIIEECANHLMTERTFAVVVWALLLATVVAPNAFHWVLMRAFAGKPKSGINQFMIKAEGPHHTGMHFEIADVLHSLHLDVIETNTESDGITSFGTWVVQTTEQTAELDHEKIHEIEHMLKEAVNSTEAQILITVPSGGYHINQKQTVNERISISLGHLLEWDKNWSAVQQRSLSRVQLPESEVNIEPVPPKEQTWLEIRIMAVHDKGIITNVLETLDNIGLHVMEGHAEIHRGVDEEVFYAKCGRRGSVSRKHTIQALKVLFHRHHTKAQIMVKKIKASDAIVGSSNAASFKTTDSGHDCLHISARNVISLKTNSVIDEVQEGYEINLKISHAERVPHLITNISRIITEKNLDLTSYDTTESGPDENKTIVIRLFIKGVIPKPPIRNRIKNQLRDDILDLGKKSRLEIKTFQITTLTEKDAHRVLQKSIKEGLSISQINEISKHESQKHMQDCMLTDWQCGGDEKENLVLPDFMNQSATASQESQ